MIVVLPEISSTLRAGFKKLHYEAVSRKDSAIVGKFSLTPLSARNTDQLCFERHCQENVKKALPAEV